MAQLQRTTFETSRAAEYFEARELQAQTGQPRQNFATVALKELVDNALDACETAGVAPEIGVEVDEDDGVVRLAVSDNGPGILPETVRKVLDFGVRVSDKAAYRAPTRGAQGNALKTVVGIPHALGGLEPVIVEAAGVRHEVRAWVDPADELRVNHDQGKAVPGIGTRVTLALPADGQDFDPAFWARSFALFNPHATVRFVHSADRYQR
jgi:DNA topoisomerase VI subunit B